MKIHESWGANTLDGYLDKRFKKIDDKWLLHEYDNWGADYGLTATKEGYSYRIFAYSESGYVADKYLFELQEKVMMDFVNSLSPTNPDYRTY